MEECNVFSFYPWCSDILPGYIMIFYLIVFFSALLKYLFSLIFKAIKVGLNRMDEEGNGNPLQCSCLGNPRDRGA